METHGLFTLLTSIFGALLISCGTGSGPRPDADDDGSDSGTSCDTLVCREGFECRLGEGVPSTDADADTDVDVDTDTDVDSDSDGDADEDDRPDADPEIEADVEEEDPCDEEEVVGACDSICDNCIDENCDGWSHTRGTEPARMLVERRVASVGESFCVVACADLGYICIDFQCIRLGTSETARFDLDDACYRAHDTTSCPDDITWGARVSFPTAGTWECTWRRGPWDSPDCSAGSEMAYACGQIEVVP